MTIDTTKNHPLTYYKLKPSFSQERFWVLHNLDPDKPTYTISKVFRFTGAFNLKAWKKSLRELVERHEILRTTFTFEERLYQRIASDQQCDFDYLELSEDLVEEAIKSYIQQPFDLESSNPLFQVKVIKTGMDTHYFLMNIHHILCDGPSLGILLEDLFRLYSSNSQQIKAELPPLEIQFADFAEWERNTVESDQSTSLEFWKENLKGAPSKVDFNKHGESQKVGTGGETTRFRVPSELQQAVKSVSKANRTTLFTTFITAFTILIYKYTSQKEISIGTPVSLKESKELENVTGLFINSLVIRSHISPLDTFNEHLKKMQEQVYDCFKHKYIPYDTIVKEISPDRDDIHNALFNIMFALHYKAGKPNLTGLEYEEILYDNRTTKLDLSLSAIVSEEEIELEVEYDTSIFNQRYINQLFGQDFMALLTDLTKDQDKPIGTLPLAEGRSVITKVNRPAISPIKSDKCIHELIEDRVANHPHANALTFRNRTLTYQELNEKSNDLAARIVNQIDRGATVGIYMDRSIELILSVLAIIKAGGVYVPLNTEDPLKRTEKVVEKANVSFLLTKHESAERIATINQKTYNVEESELGIGSDFPNLKTMTTTEGMLSIYFTSGSTGEPKGVINHHKGWINRMNGMQQSHQMKIGDAVLQKTLHTFDAFGLEVFWPLMYGGHIHLLEPGEHRNPRAIIDAMKEYRAIFLQVVPSMLNEVVLELTEEDAEALSEHLRFIGSAGEPLTSTLYNEWRKKVNCPVYNTWGPTEASIDVTQYVCTEHDRYNGDILSIGKPLMNNEVYILDEYLHPVSPYVTGDIFVSGIGLSRGYVNDPEKTKQTFLDNPFHEGTIMYRTGDKGYFLESGDIQFVGREDNQVKLRGIRVELDEIERVIMESESVNQCVVKVSENGGGQKLIAYITMLDESEVAIHKVKDELMTKLPMYMLPTHFELMKELPRLSNGKIDRKSLSIPEGKIFPSEELILPRTSKELILCQLMSDLLEHEQLGINSNFFDVGGHSLNAFKLLNRINQEFHTKLPLSFIFKHPTIEMMGKVLDTINNQEWKTSNVISLQKGDQEKRPLYLIHPGGGGIICYYEFVRKMSIPNPIYGIQSIGYEDHVSPLSSIKEMACEYIKGIKKVQPAGPYALAGWSLGGTIAFEIAHQLEEMGDEVDFIGLIDTYPIDCHRDDQQVAQSRKSPLEAWAARLNLTYAENLTDEKKIQLIHTEVKKRKMIPVDATLNETAKVLEIMYCNNLAAEEFFCDYRIHQTLHLFNVSERSEINPIPLVDTNVWAARTTKEVFIHEIDGHHHNLMDKTNVERVAGAFKNILEEQVVTHD
ncbi:hypothetical protein ASG66_03045 [Bacillus sp. Leaf406]|nr:hypothetical protein ASG66_03045 [Bacillus sp. Leaf406]